MRASLQVAIGMLLCQGLVHAQLLLEPEELRRMPRHEAVVLNPVGPWECIHAMNDSGHTSVTGMDEDAGHPRLVVAEAGKRGWWSRHLAIPFDPQRYPVLILNYRATGILDSGEPLLQLVSAKGGGIAPVANGDLLANGETQELVVDLREFDPQTEINGVHIHVHCRGLEPAVFELLGLRFLADNNLPPLEEQPGPEFPVRVVDSKGKGMEGVTVTVDAERMNWSRSGTTDAAGHVKLRAMSNPSSQHMLRVEGKGMATLYLQRSRWQQEQDWKIPQRVSLTPGVRYGGVVRNEDGKPLAGVSVNTTLHCVGPEGKTRWDIAVLTNAEGRWLSPVLPVAGGSPRIALRHPQYARSSIDNLQLGDMRTQQATFVIRRGVQLRGQVRGPDGQPVTKAQVTRRKDRYNMATGKVWTDEGGNFTFPARQLGKTTLIVQAKGLAPAMVPVDQRPGMASMAVGLEPGATLCGQVVDRDGKPLTGVRVVVDQWRKHYHAVSWEGKTDAEGRFAWHGAPADPVHLGFLKGGRMRLVNYPFEPGEKEQAIVLPPILRIRGTITDAKTGKPVLGCTMVPGIIDGQTDEPQSPPEWQQRQAKACPDGRYEVTFGSTGPGRAFALKITVQGYLPAVSRVFQADEGEQTLNLALRKGRGIEGTVLLPNGKPAAGAKVYLVLPGQYLSIGEGLTALQSEATSVQTGADGHYQFPAEEGKWLLAAGSGEGYVEVDAAAYAKSPDLKLQSWGRVEGVYRIGSKPAGGQRVSLGPKQPPSKAGERRVHHSVQAVTDEHGQFVFPRVPPGKRSVQAPISKTDGDSWIMPLMAVYEVLPGKTAHVTLGGTGRPVIGQFALPEGANQKVAWESGIGTLRTTPKIDLPRPKTPAALQGLSREEGNKRFLEWYKTKEGKAYLEAGRKYGEALQKAHGNRKARGFYQFPVNADGSFRVEDIPAGHYKLSIRLRGIGHFRHEFSVPEMVGGRSDKPLDLGTHTVTLR